MTVLNCNLTMRWIKVKTKRRTMRWMTMTGGGHDFAAVRPAVSAHRRNIAVRRWMRSRWGSTSQ